MALEEGLVTYLASQTPVTSLVQSRIYPLGGVPTRAANSGGKEVRVPMARIPYLVYETTSERPEYHSTAMAALSRASLTIHCFGDGAKATHSLAETVIGEMSGFAGSWGSETISSCMQQDRTDAYHEPLDGHGRGRHRVSLDFDVIFSKTAPTF